MTYASPPSIESNPVFVSNRIACRMSIDALPLRVWIF